MKFKIGSYAFRKLNIFYLETDNYSLPPTTLLLWSIDVPYFNSIYKSPKIFKIF